MTTPLEQPFALGRIVVPTDFSPHANVAAGWAFSMLASRGGAVMLLHIIQPTPRGSLSDEHDAECRKRLAEIAPSWAEASGIEVHVDVLHRRDMAQGILEVADSFGANLICMGSKGRSGLARAVLGSVADDVLRVCKLPLLVVPYQQPKE